MYKEDSVLGPHLDNNEGRWLCSVCLVLNISQALLPEPRGRRTTVGGNVSKILFGRWQGSSGNYPLLSGSEENFLCRKKEPQKFQS